MGTTYWMNIDLNVLSNEGVQEVIESFGKESSDFKDRWVPNFRIESDSLCTDEGECYSSDIDILGIFFNRIARYVEGSVFFEGGSAEEVWRIKIVDGKSEEQEGTIVYGDVFQHIIDNCKSFFLGVHLWSHRSVVGCSIYYHLFM